MTPEQRIRKLAAMPELPGEKSISVGLRDLREFVEAHDALLAENERLREALSAYRSALRCGEPETAQLQALGDAALNPEVVE